MERIDQSVAKRVLLKAYLASDHATAATGLTIAVKLSVNGAAFADPHAGATNATEIANGWYYVDLDSTDTGTLGPLIVRGTEGTIDDSEITYDVRPVVSTFAAGDDVNAATFAGNVPVQTSGKLWVLDGSGNAIAPAATALSTATWTGAIAGRIDAAVSSRMATFSLPTNFAAMAITSGGIVQADLQTIKTQSVTCSVGVTVSPFVGSTGAAVNGTNANTLSGHDPGATLGTGTSTLTQAQVTGGAYALNSSSFAFNTAMDFTSTQKTSLNAATPVASLSGDLTATMKTSVTTAATAATPNLNSAYDAAKTAAPTVAAIDTQLSGTHGSGAWGGGGNGSGARTVTLTINDGSAALQSANVRLTKGAATYVGPTNASGQIVFAIDDGTWSVAIALTGYTFTPTTLAVAADLSHTYSMTALSISTSPAGETTGYLVVYDKNGAVESGVMIYLRAIGPVNGTLGIAADVTERTAMSDSNGLVQFTGLLASTRYGIRRGSNSTRTEVEISSSPASTTQLPSIVG